MLSLKTSGLFCDVLFALIIQFINKLGAFGVDGLVRLPGSKVKNK